MADEGSYLVTYTAHAAAGSELRSGKVPVEEVVTLYLNGQPLVSVMCTPTRLEALTLGFLFNEGLIRSPQDVAVVRPCAGGRCIDVWLTFDVEIPDLRVITSGCSGGTTFESIASARRPVEAETCVSPAVIAALMDELSRQAGLYQSAGGVHTAGLASTECLLCVAEDVGRHNALDKVTGMALQLGECTRGRLLLTSGRISSEMVQKAARMEVPIVVSRTSPTSLAVQLAEEWGITLIGYARGRQFRVYSRPQRVTLEGSGG